MKGENCLDQQKALLSPPRVQAWDMHCGDRAGGGGVTGGATLACRIPFIYFSRSLCPAPEKALRCENNGTIRCDVQRRRGTGLLGQEPAVCSGAFPMAGPSGEACSEKTENKKVPTH